MDREKVLEYIFNLMPMLNKKLFKDFHRFEMPRQQMELLFTIKKENGKPMKYYCKKLMISKPNLTTTSNKLIKEGLLERKTDEEDRRIINLFITDKGKEFLSVYREKIKKHMLEQIEVLSDEDIKILNKNFEQMKSIFSKLD
ncbi:MarR family winged helix-turn-helix transcriptional regulator [Haloimpatiens sp. FM7330]|uniref:MarR family winged helix-turn-helix transcriptional regulator n=1 Tax=Haloimpatiens sp. FM7330 TaxID=3298610 RepID=UPI00363D09D0